jgi:hypothetical protein
MSGFTAKRITANCGIVYLHMDKERGGELATSAERSAVRFPTATPRMIASHFRDTVANDWLGDVRGDPLTACARASSRESRARTGDESARPSVEIH